MNPETDSDSERSASPVLSAADPAVHVGHLIRSLGGIGVVSFAGLAFSIAMTRLLSVADVGRVGVVRPVLDLLLIPAGLGMPICIARHVGASGGAGRARIWRTGTALALASSVALAAGMFVLMRTVRVTSDPVVARYLGWMSLMLPAMVLYETGIGYLRGTGGIPSLSAAQAGRGTILLALGIPLTAGFGMFGWGAARAGTELCAAVLALVLVRRAMLARGEARPGGGEGDAPPLNPPDAGKSLVGGFLAFGVFSALTQGAAAVPAAAEVLILDRKLADPEVIGRYSVARLIFNSLMLVPGAFVQAHFHRMAALARDREGLWDQFIQDSGTVLVIIAPVVFVGWVAAPHVDLVFGPEYAATGLYLRGMLPAVCIHAAAMVGSSFAIAAGRVRSDFAATAAGAALSVILNFALIPEFGVGGAIMAMTAGYTLRGALVWGVMIRHRYGRPGPSGG